MRSGRDPVHRSRRPALAVGALTLIVAACGESEEATRADTASEVSSAAIDESLEDSSTDSVPVEPTPPEEATTVAATEADSTEITEPPATTTDSTAPTTSIAAAVAADEPAIVATNEGGVVISEPSPPQMCPAGSSPRAAAYDKDTGDFRWASCTEEIGWQTVVHVAEDAIYLQSAFPDRAIVALDPTDGSESVEAPPPPIEEDPLEGTGEQRIIEVDGYEVTGGQDDPVVVLTPDGSTWTRDGTWVYGNVYAIGDGAVFAFERLPASRLAGYDLPTGDIRWAYEGDPYLEGLWPWLVDGQQLYTLWYDLQVRSTVDGSLIWRTDYGLADPNDPFRSPSPDAPRMSGVGVGDEVVVVSFTAEASGGD